MNDLRIRDAHADDLPQIAAWQAWGQRPLPVLPTAPHERLLVAEVLAAGGGEGRRLLAAVRLRPAIGLQLPRAWYHVGCSVHAAPELNLFHRQRTLLLGNDHTGASELADLLHADDGLPLADQALALRSVLQVALMLVAAQRQHYAGSLIAELPGLRDGAGQSPFWDGLGRHFYSGDPAQAVARHGDAWRSHVAALLPRQPVTTAFLPPAAQAAIAQVAPSALLQRELLEALGLRYSHHVTVHDGGPVLAADLDAVPDLIRSRSRSWRLADGEPEAGHTGLSLLLHTAADGTLRALRAPAQASGLRLRVAAASRHALGLLPGDALWALPLD